MNFEERVLGACSFNVESVTADDNRLSSPPPSSPFPHHVNGILSSRVGLSPPPQKILAVSVVVFDSRDHRAHRASPFLTKQETATFVCWPSSTSRRSPFLAMVAD